MNTNTHQQAAAAIANPAATTRALTHEVTSADVAAVLQRNAVQVANTDGMPFSVMAERIFDGLDFSHIERAALLAGADSVDQALAMRDAIADHLVEKGILKRKLTIIERVKADHRANMAAELGCPNLVDFLAIPDLLPVLREARAWFSTSGPVATRLDAVISEVLQAQGGKQQSIRNAMLRKALASFGSAGDIYTDAPECSASVSAKQNLSVLAQMLCQDSGELFTATLFADGTAVGEVRVQVDGALYWDGPGQLDLSAKSWTVALLGGEMVGVALFEGDADSDAQWVVDAPEAFYKALMRDGFSA